MIGHYEAVIFDLDGTLIDSMWIWPEIDKAYLGRFNKVPPEDLDQLLEGMSFTETALYFKERFQIEDSVDDIKAAWNDMAWHFYTEKIDLKPGARTFLEWLKSKNIKMGIATSNSKELVWAVLEKLEITHFFHSVRTSCEVEKGKPYPDIYLKVAQELEVEPKRCLVFEDIPNGALAAQRAGMSVWIVEDGQKEDMRITLQRLGNRFIMDYGQALYYLQEEAL